MFNQVVAARRGLRLSFLISDLHEIVPNKAVVCAQGLTRQCSNYSLVLEFLALLIIGTILISSSWVFCALNNECFQANGGMF